MQSHPVSAAQSTRSLPVSNKPTKIVCVVVAKLCVSVFVRVIILTRVWESHTG